MRRMISSDSWFEHEVGYSRAIVDGGFVFVAGTTGFDYATMTISDEVVEQAEQALRNIADALAEAGATMNHVARVRHILPDMADFEPCWPVLRRWFGDSRPAMTVFSAALLDPRMKIEIEVTAKLPD